MFIIYISIFFIIISLSLISVNNKILKVLNWLIYIAFIIIALLIMNGNLADKVRYIQAKFFEYLNIDSVGLGQHYSALVPPNVDAVFFVACGFAVVAFLIKLITDDERLENINKDPLKRNLAAIPAFPLLFAIFYLLFDSTCSLEGIDRVASMGMGQRWVVTTQTGIIFILAAGVILCTGMYGVYVKWFVNFLKLPFNSNREPKP